MIIYGMEDCVNCREAKERLDKEGRAYTFRPIGEKVEWMKTFLALRDHEPVFSEPRAEGKIGIPCFVLADGRVTLSLDEALNEAEM